MVKDTFCVERNQTILSRRFGKTVVITGFNTDIEFQGVTYHVQTEDKGVETPLILSLVYDRGTILASKRSPYDDLLVSEFDEKELTERLQRQHKLICAAVRAGRIDDLKRMTMKESASKRKDAAERKEAELVADNKTAQPAKFEKRTEEIPAPQLLHVSSPQLENAQVAKGFSTDVEEKVEVKTNGDGVWEIPISILEDLIIDEVQVVEEETILPAEAVAVIPEEEPAAAKSEPVDESLKIELLNEVAFRSGERKTLSVLVKRGNIETGLSGAHVMVKILGTSFRPQVFHAKTDSNGIAIVQLQLPRFTRGRAAVLIRAMSGGEETELRRVISQD